MTEQDYGKIISRNLKRIFLEHDKTQTDVAKDLNISKTTVSSWMNGTRIPRMNKIDLLCHYFNVSRADIMEEHNGSSNGYYLNDDAKEYAQFLFDNPEYKVLFDASRKVKKEDIDFVRKFIDKMTE